MNIIWLVGAIEEGSGECVLNFVENRKIPTIFGFINDFIEKGAIIKTDGYVSYPAAVSMNVYEHK